MRISKQFALIMASILVLACGYAAAAEGEDLGTGGEVTTDPAPKGAPDGPAADEGEFLGTGEEGTTAPAAKGAPAGGAETQPAETQPVTKRKKGLFEGNTMLFVMLGGVVLLYIFMGRSKRKQAAKRKDMLATLKKGAKVTTIGGIVGTVVEIREDEVVVKVDETNNSRLRLARWAIRGVGEEAKTQGPDQRK